MINNVWIILPVKNESISGKSFIQDIATISIESYTQYSDYLINN